MKIVCPQCALERSIPAEKLPSASVIATCPQCQHRFRIQREELDPPQDSSSVPQGAYIPDNNTPVYSQQEQSTHTKETNTHAEQDDAPYEERQRAAQAYEQQAQANTDSIENPWEYSEQIGYFAAFYQTIVRVMFAAPLFFSGLAPRNILGKALIFYLIVNILQIFIERFWGGILSSALAPEAVNDEQLQFWLNMLSPKSNIFFAALVRAAVVSVEIFFLSGIYFLAFKLIAPKEADFSLIFQVIAYSAAPIMLCLVPVIGTIVGFIWSISCTIIGCRHALRLSWPQTLMGIVPLYVLGLVVFLQFIQLAATQTG